MSDSEHDGVKPVTANEFVEQELHRGLQTIEAAFSCDALSLFGPLYPGVDDILRSVIEKRCGGSSASNKLVILLTTQAECWNPFRGWLRRSGGTIRSLIS
jgi:hypothetical protein